MKKFFCLTKKIKLFFYLEMASIQEELRDNIINRDLSFMKKNQKNFL